MPYPPWLPEVEYDVARILTLAPDWNSYNAPAIDARATTAALGFCREVTSDTPKPRVVPTVHAGVQLEWHGAMEVELDFDRHGGLRSIIWERFRCEASPGWARGVLARALHHLR